MKTTIMPDVTIYLTIAGFILQLIVIVGTGIWRLSQLESALRSAIADARTEIDGRISDLRKEIDSRMDEQGREFGESVQALRQKIHEVEIWSRDIFMRRDGFYKVKEEVTNALKEVRDELKKDLRRLEEKIDTKT